MSVAIRLLRAWGNPAAQVGAPATVPPQVTGVTATPASTTVINVAWSAAVGALTYDVDSSPDGSTWTNRSTGASLLTYPHSALTAGTRYYYRVRGVNATGNGTYSATVDTYTWPAAVGTVTVTPISSSQLDLSWTALSPAPATYRVERSADGSTGWAERPSSPTTNAYSDTGLTAATLYYYRVRARNAGGDGAYSSVASGTTSGGAFNPMDLSPTLWLKATAGVYKETAGGSTLATADSDPVGTWRDQSGAARHFTCGADVIRPTLKLAGNGINSLACLRFDGSDDFLTSGLALSTFITNTAYCLWVVFRPSAIDTNAANTYDNDAVVADGVGSGGYFGVHLKSGLTAHAYNYDTTDDQVSAPVTLNTALLIHTRHEGGTLYISKNGGTESSVASGNTGVLTGIVTLGIALNSARYTGDIAEVFLVNSALTSGQRTSETNYLKSLYGL